MFPKLYKISEENFLHNLKYFYITNKKVKECHECLFKFVEYTNEYCSKLDQLFKEGKNILDDYEIIDEDYLLIDSNNTNKNNNFEKFFLFPIDKSAEILHNFFNDLVKYLSEFIKNLENPIKGIEQFIDISKNEISSLKDNYIIQKKIFENKFMEYKNLNNELKSKYEEGEKNLIEFCLEGRKNKLNYESNLKISFANLVKEEKEIITKYNSLGNYEKVFFDSTKDKITSIQEYTSTLFFKFENISKNIYDIFNMSFSTPMNNLINEKNKLNQEDDLEAKLKKDFNFLLNNYINNIDEKNLKLNLDNYNIKVIEDSVVKTLEATEDKKIKHNKKEKKSDKTHNNINKSYIDDFEQTIVLTDEEIFFIVYNMYQEYKLINRNKYDLKIEETKLQLKKVLNKLLAYGKKNNNSSTENNDKNNENKENNEDNEKIISEENNQENEVINYIINNNIIKNNNNSTNNEISKEDMDFIIKLMKDKNYRSFLLIQLNNFRALGRLEMPPKIYDYFVQIFSEISANLYNFEEKNEEKKCIKDYFSSKLIIILAQTFYVSKNNSKVYLSDDMKNEKIFRLQKFWKELIKYMIDTECKERKDNMYLNNDKNKIKKMEDDIYLAQIVPFIGSMSGFGNTKDEIRNLMNELIKEYDISEKNYKIILGMIDNNIS